MPDGGAEDAPEGAKLESKILILPRSEETAVPRTVYTILLSTCPFPKLRAPPSLASLRRGSIGHCQPVKVMPQPWDPPAKLGVQIRGYTITFLG